MTDCEGLQLQPKKESQKDRKNPLLDKKEETQAPVPLKKEGIRRVGRKPDQQGPQQGSQQQGGPGEGRPGDRRPDRRPPRERRFDKPGEEKPEGGEFSVEKSAGDRPMRGRGGGRGGRGGRGRGMGRGDGFDSRGKREFDRHSGSDRSSLKAEEKRGGSGSHNWGTVKDELTELDQSNVTEETAEGEEHPPADSENKENEVEEVKEEGPKEMTLDEWKAMQDKERAKVEFNIRKANEGADSQWKKGYVLHKSKSDDRPAGTLIYTAETDAETSVYQKLCSPLAISVFLPLAMTRPESTTSGSRPTTSRPSWRSTSETWAAQGADAGDPAVAGEGVVAAEAVVAAAGAGRHVGEDLTRYDGKQSTGAGLAECRSPTWTIQRPSQPWPEGKQPPPAEPSAPPGPPLRGLHAYGSFSLIIKRKTVIHTIHTRGLNIICLKKKKKKRKTNEKKDLLLL
ncbi:hypothetical protein JZ751_024941 [Albula glossodonta]|uniref:Hyaluronan/mRNA-binding protein domain-containing protein n=1 Tax=Albula glossodonta TaxID=121402 RepID=A0A8T2PIS0_9TELE|nr:hypothetical protein JZ751_024941 [Albula glossodonta]